MKFLRVVICFVLLTGCDFNAEVVDPREVISESEETIGSFRMGNGEIREEMLAELEKRDIQHWLNDDNTISYLLADGEIIDTIGNEIILAYIRRN